MRHDSPLVVLFSLSRVRPTTNPYLLQLIDSLPGHVRVELFSWRRALFGRYAVFHVHWPEVLFRKRGRARSAVAQVLYALLMARLWLTRIPMVWTAHNVAPHEGATRAEQMLLAMTRRRTSIWVTLNDFTPLAPGAVSRLIPLGVAPPPFTAADPALIEPGRLLHFGLVRRYKGVEELVDAFRSADADGATLRIVGRCDDPTYRDAVADRARTDPRISADLRHLDDDELARELAAAQLVVLPYRAMHNSGALLLALSMARPVLVPNNDVTAALAREVGDAWVLRFEAPLTPTALTAALESVRTAVPAAPPRLGARGWDAIGQAHAEVYETAAGLRR